MDINGFYTEWFEGNSHPHTIRETKLFAIAWAKEVLKPYKEIFEDVFTVHEGKLNKKVRALLAPELERITYNGYSYLYEWKEARPNIDFVLHTMDPSDYCKGIKFFTDSPRMQYVIVKTNNPNLIEHLKRHSP